MFDLDVPLQGRVGAVGALAVVMGAVVPLQDVLPAPPNHLLAGRSLFLLSLDHGLKQFQHDVLLVFGFGEGVGCLLVLEGQRDKGVAGVGVGWWWGWSWREVGWWT